MELDNYVIRKAVIEDCGALHHLIQVRFFILLYNIFQFKLNLMFVTNERNSPTMKKSLMDQRSALKVCVFNNFKNYLELLT